MEASMIRFRDTYGHSWTTGPGERRWASHSVSYGPGTGLFALCWFAVWWMFVVLPLAMLWLEIEMCLLAGSFLWALASRASDATRPRVPFRTDLRWAWRFCYVARRQ
jgi:hypothetical protein